MLLITVLNVCLMIFLIDAAYQPPKFSDAPVQYEDKTDDYYDLKNYDYLGDEESLYRKSPPGGLQEGGASAAGAGKATGKAGKPGKGGKPGKPGKPGNPGNPAGKKEKKNKKKNKKAAKNPQDAKQPQNGRNTTPVQPPRQLTKDIKPGYPTNGRPNRLTNQRMMEITEKIDNISKRMNRPGYPTMTITRKRLVNGKWEDM
uniref:Collagen-like salivary secreted protein n=1 Tax=Simulium nigrimanum TaxID=683695 RepID=D1FPR9_SIMNI